MVCYRLLISLGSKIYSFNTPDFTKVQRINNNFKCPNNGWINVYRGIYDSQLGGNSRLYINGHLIKNGWLYWDNSYKYDQQNYNIIPVAKNDVITFSGGNNGVYFTPCREKAVH